MDPVAALELKSVERQIPRNNKDHHTQEMGSTKLILRRGQDFSLTLTFNRPFQPQKDHLTFVVETGPEPSELLGTRATFLLTQSQTGNVWSASDFTADSNSLQVSIFIPASAVIGHYTLQLEISQDQGPGVTYPLGNFILLFNPWSTDDDVYLPSETLLQEYVMSDYGFVYKGQENSITSRPWNYGQALLHGGSTREPFWRHAVHLSVDFEKELQWPLLLPYSNYRSKLTDEKLIHVSGIAEVEETGRFILVLKDFSLEPPHLSIEVFERAEVGKTLNIYITLTNTLMVALNNCTMVLEGSGLINGQITKDLGTLMAGHTIQIQLELYPIKAGPHQLQVLISSSEVKEIKGYKDIVIAAAPAS